MGFLKARHFLRKLGKRKQSAVDLSKVSLGKFFCKSFFLRFLSYEIQFKNIILSLAGFLVTAHILKISKDRSTQTTSLEMSFEISIRFQGKTKR